MLQYRSWRSSLDWDMSIGAKGLMPQLGQSIAAGDLHLIIFLHPTISRNRNGTLVGAELRLRQQQGACKYSQFLPPRGWEVDALGLCGTTILEWLQQNHESGPRLYSNSSSAQSLTKNGLQNINLLLSASLFCLLASIPLSDSRMVPLIDSWGYRVPGSWTCTRTKPWILGYTRIKAGRPFH